MNITIMAEMISLNVFFLLTTITFSINNKESVNFSNLFDYRTCKRLIHERVKFEIVFFRISTLSCPLDDDRSSSV